MRLAGIAVALGMCGCFGGADDDTGKRSASVDLPPPLCQVIGAECGPILGPTGELLSCGSCQDPETCGGSGTPNQCGCTPTTCAAAGVTCGSVSDGCGQILTCGSCEPPVLSPIGNKSVDLGSTLTIQLSATDADGDALSYSVAPQPIPDHATFDATSGLFTFHPDQDQVGTVDVEFFVTDGELSDSEAITITVNGASPGAPTNLTGRVLDANAYGDGSTVPIVGATVRILGSAATATSDSSGYFTLTSIPSGHQVFDIDTSTASPGPGGVTYGGFREAMDVIASVTNVIDRPFFLPRIEAISNTTVNPNATTTVTNSRLGITLSIPAHTAKAANGADFAGTISISEVPPGLAPAALPEHLVPGLLITIQPVGVTYASPIPITFSNFNELAPDSLVDIWSLDAKLGRFSSVGTGQVSTDGLNVVTISGGIRANDWHAIMPLQAEGEPEPEPDRPCPTRRAGSDVTIATGNLRVEHSIPAYVSQGQSRAPRLVYTSLQADPRPIIGVNTTILRTAAVPDLASIRLRIGGTNQGTAIFTDTNALSESIDETFYQSIQFDARAFASGLYGFDLQLTSHYTANRPTAISSIIPGRVVVNNQRTSSFGAGWTLAGLSRVIPKSDGSALVIEGDGDALDFNRPTEKSGSVRVVESGWRIDRITDFASAGAAHYNPQDGLLYVLNRDTTANGGGLYRVNADGTTTFIVAHDRPAALVVDPDDGDMFVSENFGGNIYRTAFGATTRSLWVSGFHADDDDPIGMAIAPNGYSGSVLAPGQALIVDQGFNGADGVWRFSPDTAEGEVEIVPDSSALLDANDVTINDSEVYVADTAGFIYRVEPGGALTILPTLERIREPVAITFDPATDNLLVVDRWGQRLVRVDTVSGAVSTIARGFHIPSSANTSRWAGLDTTPDGSKIFVTDGNGKIFTFASDNMYATPPGDFSTLVKNGDGTFTRSWPEGTTVQFDAQGRQVSETDNNANTTTWSYDGSGRLTTIEDPVGRQTTFTYSGGLLATITDPTGRQSQFEHDTDGNLSRIVNPDTSSRRFTYDLTHRMTSQVSERGFATSYAYDQFGRFKSATWPDGSTRELIARSVAALFDPASGSGSESDPAPVLRAQDLVATYTDGEGRESVYVLDSLGSVVSYTDPAGLETVYERNEVGLVTRLLLPSTHETTYQNDIFGNVVSMTDELKSSTGSWSYSQPLNLLDEAVGFDGNATTFDYDAQGNRTSTESFLGRIWASTYDAAGNMSSFEEPTGLDTGYSYDSFDNSLDITVGTGPTQRITSYTRDSQGLVSAIEDALNGTTTFTRDSLGRITRTTLPDGRVIDRTYDGAGNVSSITPPGRPAHDFGYTPNDQLSRYNPPDVGPPGEDETLYEYNLAGQLVRTFRANAETIEQTYDTAGRLATVTSSAGTNSLTYSSTTGQLTSVTAPGGGTLALSYDGEAPVGADWTGGFVQGDVEATWDSSYRLATLQVSGTPAVSYGYNADGLLTSAGAISFTRIAATGLVTAATIGSLDESWTYTAFDEVASYSVAIGATPIYSVSYTYDALGRLDTRTETVSGTTTLFEYTYDLGGRLVEVVANGVVVEAYGYDDNNNRTSEQTPAGTTLATYDDQDRVVTYGTRSYSFDDAGDLDSVSEGISTTTFAYDGLGNLRSVVLPGGSTINYVIDGLDRRIGKRVGGTLTQGFLYKDDLEPVAELDNSNNVVSVFVYGSHPHVPDYLVRGGVTYRIISDRAGSPRLVVNVSTGAVAAERRYTAFGRVVFDSNPTWQPFGLAGGLYDPDTGLTRFGARDYDARTGRWTTKDPALFAGDHPNLYLYAGADPLNHFDVNGHATDTVRVTCTESPALCKEIGFTIGTAAAATAAAGIAGLGAYGIWRWIHDCLTRAEPVPLPLEASRPKPTRSRCLDAAAAGGAVWEEFCRSIRDPATKKSCWSKGPESEQKKRGFCDNYF
jgi:RHS repeat-associated protein